MTVPHHLGVELHLVVAASPARHDPIRSPRAAERDVATATGDMGSLRDVTANLVDRRRTNPCATRAGEIEPEGNVRRPLGYVEHAGERREVVGAFQSQIGGILKIAQRALAFVIDAEPDCGALGHSVDLHIRGEPDAPSDEATSADAGHGRRPPSAVARSGRAHGALEAHRRMAVVQDGRVGRPRVELGVLPRLHPRRRVGRQQNHGSAWCWWRGRSRLRDRCVTAPRHHEHARDREPSRHHPSVRLPALRPPGRQRIQGTQPGDSVADQRAPTQASVTPSSDASVYSQVNPGWVHAVPESGRVLGQPGPGSKHAHTAEGIAAASRVGSPPPEQTPMHAHVGPC